MDRRRSSADLPSTWRDTSPSIRLQTVSGRVPYIRVASREPQHRGASGSQSISAEPAAGLASGSQQSSKPESSAMRQTRRYVSIATSCASVSPVRRGGWGLFTVSPARASRPSSRRGGSPVPRNLGGGVAFRARGEDSCSRRGPGQSVAGERCARRRRVCSRRTRPRTSAGVSGAWLDHRSAAAMARSVVVGPRPI